MSPEQQNRGRLLLWGRPSSRRSGGVVLLLPFLVVVLLLFLLMGGSCSPPPPLERSQEGVSRSEGGGGEKSQAEETFVEEAGREGHEPLAEGASPEEGAPPAEGGVEPAPPEEGPVETFVAEPLEGFDPDAGLPPDYAWKERGGGHSQKVASFQPAKGASFGQSRLPQVIKGPPRGGGEYKGSLDVLSLGCGGVIILEFRQPLIGNGPGPDFIVFENAFYSGPSKKMSFAEPGQVSVSVDGKKWYAFPCDPKNSSWPYPQCAGVHPVKENPSDPYDPKQTGGDAFDLQDVGLPYARFVRIEDRSRDLSSAARWCGGESAGFDLDAITVIWGYQP